MLPSIQIWGKTESLWAPQCGRRMSSVLEMHPARSNMPAPFTRKGLFHGKALGICLDAVTPPDHHFFPPCCPTASPCPAHSSLPLPRGSCCSSLPQPTSDTWPTTQSASWRNNFNIHYIDSLNFKRGHIFIFRNLNSYNKLRDFFFNCLKIIYSPGELYKAMAKLHMQHWTQNATCPDTSPHNFITHNLCTDLSQFHYNFQN